MRLNVQLVFWSCAMTFCVLFWVAVVGCVAGPQTPPPPQPLQEARAAALTREDFNLELVGRANREASYLPGQFATVNVYPMPSLADVEGGLPILQRPASRPIIGQEFILSWLTRAVATYPEGVPDSYDPAKRVPPGHWTLPSIETHRPALRPDRMCALLISLEKPGPPQPIPGAAGAMLQVPPRYVLMPDRIDNIEPWNRPGVPFEFVQDGYGQIMLRLQVPNNINGLRVWCQLLVEDRRVPAGCVSTPMIELHIGAQ